MSNWVEIYWLGVAAAVALDVAFFLIRRARDRASGWDTFCYNMSKIDRHWNQHGARFGFIRRSWKIEFFVHSMLALLSWINVVLELVDMTLILARSLLKPRIKQLREVEILQHPLYWNRQVSPEEVWARIYITNVRYMGMNHSPNEISSHWREIRQDDGVFDCELIPDILTKLGYGNLSHTVIESTKIFKSPHLQSKTDGAL